MRLTDRPRFVDSSVKEHTSGRLAVIDIGSSMVRLVIYDSGRYPHLYLNHKVWALLGKGKGEGTFRLNSDRVERTMSALEWFLWVCRQSEVSSVLAIASSAIRDAENGEEFVQQVRDKFGLHVEVISGETEAKLSAMGAICSIPDAKGAIVDLGGGSLDIASSKNKSQFSSLPYGVLTLQTLSKNDPHKAEQILLKKLKEVSWLKNSGADLVALGSGMRSIARLHMAEKQYPVKVLHDYTIERDEALAFCADFMAGNVSRRLSRMTRSWREILPYRAAVLNALLKSSEFKQVRFAAFGVREGVLFSQIDRDVMIGDPLIAFAEDMAERDGRGVDYARHLFEWVKPYCKNVDARLLKAAALFSETRWRENAVYRSRSVFESVYGGSYVAATHHERVMLSLMCFFRYEDKLLPGMLPRFKGVISDADILVARKVGDLFNIASYLDPGAQGDLTAFKLVKIKGKYRLQGPEPFMVMKSEAVEVALESLNNTLHD